MIRDIAVLFCGDCTGLLGDFGRKKIVGRFQVGEKMAGENV